MGFIFRLLGGDLILKVLWYTFFITFLAGFISLLFYLFTTVFNALLTLYNSLQELLRQISDISSNSSNIVSQIYGLVDCVGLIDGINAGLPFIISAVFIVLNVYLSKYAVKFSTYFINLIVSLKP